MTGRVLGWVFWLGLVAAAPGRAEGPRLIYPQNLVGLTQLGPPRQDPQREWTFLYYLDGDNSLEPLHCRTLGRIENFLRESPAIRPRAEIIVLFDRAAQGRPWHMPTDGGWTEARVYRALPGEHIAPDFGVTRFYSELLSTCGELNMGDPATLQTFVAAAARAFPAKHYAVILDNHGGGWQSCTNDDDAPNADRRQDYLSLPEIQTALRGALQAMGRSKFELVVFDMCLMGQLEAAVACKDAAETVIFSEAIVNDTWMWKAFLACAFEKEGQDVREVARKAIPRWGSYYDADREAQKRATLSALDCGKVDALLKSLNALLAKLTPAARQHWATFSRALYQAEHYGLENDLHRGREALASVDLIHALKSLRANVKEFPAEAEYRDFLAAAEQCVLASFSGFRYRRSAGLAVYAPLRAENYNPGYGDEPFAKCTSWPKFLATLHTLQSHHPDVPKFHSLRIQDSNGQLTNTVMPLAGHWGYFVLEGSNLLGINLALGSQREDLSKVVWYRGPGTQQRTTQEWRDLAEDERHLRTPAFREGKSVLGIRLPGLTLQVASDDQTVPATVEMIEDEEAAVVRGLYSHALAGEKVDVELHFDAHRLMLVGVRARTRSIQPQPDGLFWPTLDVLQPDGSSRRVPGSQVRWGHGPRLVLNFVPPGEQMLILEAESITGKTDTAWIPFKSQPNPSIEELLKKGPRLTPEMLAGTWQWQVPHLDKQTGRTEFQDWNLRVEFLLYPAAPGHLVYRTTGPKKDIPGFARVETHGLPMLTLYVGDGHGNLRRDLAFVALYEPVGGTPAIRLWNLSSGELCRFVKIRG